MANDYAGMLERWKVDLARSRLRAFGIARSEEGDMLQVLVPKMLRFRFDPAKANGGGETAALRKIVDDCLADHLRSRERRKRRTLKYGRLLRRRDAHVVDDTSLRVDVRLALEQLPERERTVCEGLAGGKPKTHIARDLGLSPGVVRRIIRDVQRRFRKMGLGGWVGE